MIYKDLEVYKRAQKVAVDMHVFLSKKDQKITPDMIQELNSLSRTVLANLAEGGIQNSSKARRFMNYKARDVIHRLMTDLEFLHDVKSLPTKEFHKFYSEYEICSKMIWKLNESLREKEATAINGDMVKA